MVQTPVRAPVVMGPPKKYLISLITTATDIWILNSYVIWAAMRVSIRSGSTIPRLINFSLTIPCILQLMMFIPAGVLWCIHPVVLDHLLVTGYIFSGEKDSISSFLLIMTVLQNLGYVSEKPPVMRTARSFQKEDFAGTFKRR